MSGIEVIEVSDDETAEAAPAAAAPALPETIVLSDDEAAEAAPAAAAPAATKQNRLRRRRSTDEVSDPKRSTGNKTPAFNLTINSENATNTVDLPGFGEKGQPAPASTEAKYGLYELELGYKFELSQHDLDIIKDPKGWLTTSGIEFCLGILTGDPTNLANKWFLYNGDFYSQKLLGKNLGWLTQYDRKYGKTRPFYNRKFIVPIHDKNHWAVVMVDVGGKSIIMYDSFADEDRSTLVIHEIKAYVKEKLTMERKECNFDVDWRINVEDKPKQMDGFNCGIYVYLRVRQLIEGTPMLFGKNKEALKSYLENVRNDLVKFIKSCPMTQ